MKNIIKYTKILILIFMGLYSNLADAQCKAEFYTIINNLSVSYHDTSTVNAGNITSYYWNFGDGNTSYQQSPVHVYNTRGTYTVFYAISTSAGCSDSTSHQIMVDTGAGNVYHCNAKYYYDDTLGGADSVYFYGPYNASGIPYATYSWDFGDGGTSTLMSPVHKFNSIVTQLVCLTVTDTNCSNSYCDSVTFIGFNGCRSYYNYTTKNDTVSFTGYSFNSIGNVTYNWDFGDGTNSSQQSPTHIYGSNGNYYVCLKITDTSSTNTYCHYINLYPQNANHYTFVGHVFAGNTFAYPATVWAIIYDTTAGTLTAVDSTQTDSGGFFIFDVKEGHYLVKAALDSNNSNYNNYFPTYYNNKLHWDTAYLINLDTDKYNINITMVQGNNPGGPGFIGGKTSQGANKTEAVGDPIPHIQIDLLDANKKAVAYTYSDAQGNYKFNNLAYGTYYLHPEIAGKKTLEMKIILSTSNPMEEYITVEVNRFYVTCYETATTIRSVAIETGIEIWPNPATDHLYIKSEKTITQINITDITGKQIMNILKPENTLDISTLEAGLYIIQIKTKDGANVPYKFVKQ